MTTAKSIIKLSAFALLAFAIAGTPILAHAQITPPTDTDTTATNAVKKIKHKKKNVADTNAPAMTMPIAAATSATPTMPAAPTAATTLPQAGNNKSGVLPFHGKLKAVDTVAETISVGTRTFIINSETIIIKDGKPAVLADGKVGDDTGGAYKKTAEGKLVVTKLRFGAKSAAESAK